MTDQLQAGALKVRSPLHRHRPWVSDTRWIAHEGHPLFGRLAGSMPGPGLWQLTQEGPTKVADQHHDLTALMAELVAAAQPCVVHQADYQRADTMEGAAANIGAQPPVEVLDPDGKTWLYDSDIVEGAAGYVPGWTWRIAPHGDGACLVGFDRKDRPRFAVAALEPPA